LVRLQAQYVCLPCPWRRFAFSKWTDERDLFCVLNFLKFWDRLKYFETHNCSLNLVAGNRKLSRNFVVERKFRQVRIRVDLRCISPDHPATSGDFKCIDVSPLLFCKGDRPICRDFTCTIHDISLAHRSQWRILWLQSPIRR
jgi:hypothetical protein